MDSILVVCYSYTGVSRRAAQLLSSHHGWPLGEIADARPRGTWRCVLDSLLRRRPEIHYRGPDPGDFRTVVLVAPSFATRSILCWRRSGSFPPGRPRTSIHTSFPVGNDSASPWGGRSCGSAGIVAQSQDVDVDRVRERACVQACRALGVRVDRTRVLLVVAAVALACFATATTGPIAFVAFLAGPEAAYITGQVIRVNGGLLM